MENLPSSLQWDLIRPNLGNQWLWLCKFVVSTKPTQYYARNTEDVTYDSQAYGKMPFEVGGQVRSGEGSIPEVVLQVSALNEVLYDIVRSTQGAVGSAVKLIKVNSDFLATDISALEADYELMASQADDDWIYFTLGVPNPMKQRFPLRDYSSSICPWAHPDHFKGVRCGYAGADPTCDGTLEDCITKSNETMWGGEIGMDPIGMMV